MDNEQENELCNNSSKKSLLLNKWVGVRFTVKEYEAVKKKAIKAGITLSRFLRQAATGTPVLQRLTDEELEHVRQLGGMASNLNQMAHKGHAEGFIHTAQGLAMQSEKIQELITKLKL